MTSQSISRTPAAWYPDPCARHEFRYWDGGTWTDHVSDQGETAVDPVVASAVRQAAHTGDGSALEAVLKTVLVSEVGRIASAWSMHLTNRRLVVEPMHVQFHTGGLITPGGLVGSVIGQKRYETEAKEMFRHQSPVDAGKLDEILRSERRAYAINYADIANVELRLGRHGPQGVCKIRSAARKATLAIDREMFDEVSAILTAQLGGKVTRK